MAARAETLQVGSTFQKKDMFRVGHNATREHAVSIGDSALVELADALRNFQRPQSAGGAATLANPTSGGQLQLYTSSEGVETYAFSSVSGDPGNIAGSSANFGVASTGGTVTDFFQRVMATSSGPGFPWEGNTGSKLETAVAYLIAQLPAAAGAVIGGRLDNALGRDVDVFAGWPGPVTPRFEVKYTEQEDGSIQLSTGASPPKAIDTDKYFIALASDRSYLVHAPILVGILQADTAALQGKVSPVHNARMGANLVKNLNDVPELRAEMTTILRRISTTSGTRFDLARQNMNHWTNEVHLGINSLSSAQRERVIFTLARLYADDQITTRVASQSRIKADRTGGIGGITDDLYETIKSFYDAYVDGDIAPDFRGNNTLLPAGNPQMQPPDVRGPAGTGALGGTPKPNTRLKTGFQRKNQNVLTGPEYNNLLNYYRFLSSYLGFQTQPDLTIPAGMGFKPVESGLTVSVTPDTSIVTGQNIRNYLTDANKSPVQLANYILNFFNNPSFPDELKTMVMGSLTLDLTAALGGRPGSGWNRTPLKRLHGVMNDIKMNNDALTAILRELLRSEKGRENIHPYMTDDIISYRGAKGVAEEYLPQINAIKAQMHQMSDDIIDSSDLGQTGFAGTFDLSNLPDIKDTVKDTIDRKYFNDDNNKIYLEMIVGTAHTGPANARRLRVGQLENLSSGNYWWTSLERGDHWTTPGKDWDKQLFEYIFKRLLDMSPPSYDDPMSDGSITIGIRQLVTRDPMLKEYQNQVKSLMNDTLQALKSQIEKGVVDDVNKYIHDFRANFGRPAAMAQKLDVDTLYPIETNYHASLSQSDKQRYESLTRDEQIEELFTQNLINSEQAKVLKRRPPALSVQIPASDKPTFTQRNITPDMYSADRPVRGMQAMPPRGNRSVRGMQAMPQRGMSATGRRGLTESELYERILKKILYTAKKRR